MSYLSHDSLNGTLIETVFCEKKCKDHHSWEDEYGSQHPCPNCHTTDGNERWVEYHSVKNRRIRLNTNPGDPHHKKIRRIVSGESFYEVEDHHGNTGMYRTQEMELA